MKISKKRKKTPRDIIISQRCTKNHDHMLYCSWDMACDVYNYFSFCPFTLLRTQKVKIKKKMKEKPGDIIILHKCTKNHDHMLYCSWDMVCDRCNYFSLWAIFCPFTSVCYLVPEIWCVKDVIVIIHFGLFFALLPPPLIAWKIKISKKWKKSLEISSFYKCVPKIMIRWCMVPKIWCTTDGRTDRRTDALKNWHIEVGAPPKNLDMAIQQIFA